MAAACRRTRYFPYFLIIWIKTARRGRNRLSPKQNLYCGKGRPKGRRTRCPPYRNSYIAGGRLRRSRMHMERIRRTVCLLPRRRDRQKLFGLLVNKYNLFLEKGIYRQEGENASERVCPGMRNAVPAGNSICLNCVNKKKLLGRLWDILRPHKAKLIWSPLLFIGVLLIGLINPLYQ